MKIPSSRRETIAKPPSFRRKPESRGDGQAGDCTFTTDPPTYDTVLQRSPPWEKVRVWGNGADEWWGFTAGKQSFSLIPNMPPNRMKQKLLAGEPAFGVSVMFPSL